MTEIKILIELEVFENMVYHVYTHIYIHCSIYKMLFCECTGDVVSLTNKHGCACVTADNISSCAAALWSLISIVSLTVGGG